MREQTRDAASVDAKARDRQVVAGASGDSAKLQLARGWCLLFVSFGAREREPRVTLDALARGKHRVALRLSKSIDAAVNE